VGRSRALVCPQQKESDLRRISVEHGGLVFTELLFALQQFIPYCSEEKSIPAICITHYLVVL